MKNLVAKIKSTDYKQLAIDHGEKIFAGLLGLLLLLALVATSWSRYERTPAELTEKVSRAHSAIAEKTWPVSEQELYTLAAGLQDDEVHNLLNDDDNKRADFIKRMQDDYEYETSIAPSVYRRVEPAREPELLAAIEPIATFVRLLYRFSPDEPELEVDEEADEPDDYRRRDIGSGRGARNTGGGGSKGGGGKGGGSKGAGGSKGDDGSKGAGGGGSKGGGGKGGGGKGGGGRGAFRAGSAEVVVRNARGVRAISVRAVVPLHRQVEMVKIALSLPSHRDAEDMVMYDDFHLQRRSKPASSTQSYSDWEEVDIRTSKEMLEEAAGWDPLINDIAITDPVLTMNLVSRVLRYWSKEEASHPLVDNYALPPRQRELQMEMVREFLDQNIESAQRINERRSRGFADTQLRGGRMGRGGFGLGGRSGIGSRMSGRGRQDSPAGNNSRGAMGRRGRVSQQLDTTLQAIAERLNKDNPEEIKQEMLEQYMKSQTASGRLLLFRYIDFDVKPATTYQYRVQLVLVNPNFNRPTQRLENPETGKQEFLETPMSEPTAPVTVPDDLKFYLTRVDRESGANPPSAHLDVFQWSTEYGTTINKNLKVYFGAFVGERTKAEVLDPAEGEFPDDVEVEFKSGDVLVDVSKAPLPIDAADHPDLNQLPLEKLKKGLGVAEQALIVNQFGDLVAYDPVSLQSAHEKARGDLKKEREPFQDLKGTGRAGDADGAPDFGAYEDQFSERRGAGGRAQRQGQRGEANPLRRGGRGAGGRGAGGRGAGGRGGR